MKKKLSFLLFYMFLTGLNANEECSNNPMPFPDDCITSSAWKCPSSCAPYATLEFLYLKTYEDELDFTQRTGILDTPIPLNILIINDVLVNFDWNPAFRVGLGYNLPYDGWDLRLNWMYHHTNPITIAESTIPELGLQITMDQGNVVGIEGEILATRASENWKMNYNAIVLEMGRDYFVGCMISLRPSIGIKGATINQSLFVRYEDIFLVNQMGIGPFIGDQKYKGFGNFFGIGPRMGISTEWDLFYNLNLFANASFTLFGGRFHSKATIVNFGNGDDIRQNVTKDSRFLTRANADLLVGLGWGKCICDHYGLSLSLGYEIQYFWQQMEIPFQGIPFPAGDLSFHGLNASLRFDF